MGTYTFLLPMIVALNTITGKDWRRPNCLMTLSGQWASTATSYTKAAVVIHRPWSCVHTEDIPSGARAAIAEGLYGSHTMSSGVNRSNSATNSG